MRVELFPVNQLFCCSIRHMFGSFTKCILYLLVKLILHIVYIQAESREGDKSVFFSRRGLKLTGGKKQKIQKVEENGKRAV